MSTTTSTTPPERSTERSSGRGTARARLLAAANELFYEEGVHTVGIDRVIERAGVAKASLYNAFGSKEELIREYLANRHETRVARMTNGLARYDNPRDRLLGAYDVLAEVIAEPGFRGCAFTRARAESSSDSKVTQVCDISRAWTRQLFTDLARDAGVADSGELGRQLHLLYDGATATAYMDRDLTAAATARATAAVLLDAALAS
jgi:AcrR family transcriptional regulator